MGKAVPHLIAFYTRPSQSVAPTRKAWVSHAKAPRRGCGPDALLGRCRAIVRNVDALDFTCAEKCVVAPRVATMQGKVARMGFLDDVSASLNRGVNAVGRSGKAAQIKLQMGELLKQRKDMAAQLGASLYDATKDNPELRAGREALYDGIAKIDADRAQMQATIEALEAEQAAANYAAQQIKCPNCGTWVSVNDAFCSGCGTSVEQIKAAAATSAPAATPAGATCPNCGAPVAEGDAFCMSCGQKLQ